MAVTIKFYSADISALKKILTPPQKSLFQQLFSSKKNTDVMATMLLDQLDVFPTADFSLHLVLPTDMDLLCKALHQQNAHIPSIFRQVLVNQLWYDGSSASLTLLAESFTSECADLNEIQIKHAASEWTKSFKFQEELEKTEPYKAVVQLHAVAKDAAANKRSLVLFLLGAPSVP
jgi:hypothetical protein